MTRTTLKIDDPLLRDLKRRAAEQGKTLQAVANEVLRHGLRTSTVRPFRLGWKGWDGELRPGLDIADRDVLFDRMGGRHS